MTTSTGPTAPSERPSVAAGAPVISFRDAVKVFGGTGGRTGRPAKARSAKAQSAKAQSAPAWSATPRSATVQPTSPEPTSPEPTSPEPTSPEPEPQPVTERDGEVRAVDGVTLDVRAGEIFGVIGYSGAGKSTLVRLVNALEPLTSGSVVVEGRDLTTLPERELRKVRAGIGMIFQQFNLFSSRTVAGNVAYPLAVARWPKERRRARVAELLEFVGLTDKARQYPAQLSGGQKQRVGIARALATNPRILLADEATSALDPETTRDVLALLRRVNRELGITVVVITHEMDVVKYLCDRVAVMENGKVVEHGDVYSVFAHPQHPATRGFVGTSLRDRPTPEALARLRTRHPGRMVMIGIREDGGSTTDLTRALRDHPVDGTVVYGGITEVAERPFGSLTLELTGDDGAVDAFVADLARTTTVLDLGSAAAPRDLPDDTSGRTRRA